MNRHERRRNAKRSRKRQFAISHGSLVATGSLFDTPPESVWKMPKNVRRLYVGVLLAIAETSMAEARAKLGFSVVRMAIYLRQLHKAGLIAVFWDEDADAFGIELPPDMTLDALH